MFAKPFRVKTQNAIKGSDRKKLRTELGNLYPGITKAKLVELVPNKEEMTIAKVHCHNGQTILVYCLQRNPIFFDVDRIVYPTVYLLWKYPDLLPAFRTWPQVLPKIQGGADLMLPGIYVEGQVTAQTLGNLPKSTTCAIKLLGNNAPMVVGYTTLSSRDMIQDAGMKGKGVISVHYYGDHMWEFGDKSDPPLLEDTVVPEEDLSDVYTDDENCAHNAGPEACETRTDGAPGSVPAEQAPAAERHSAAGDEEDGVVPGVDGLTLEEEADTMEEDPRTRQEQMDELLRWCFMCALKVSLKRGDLPILTSNFYRNHMLPCCPQGKTLDIKKSSYKKLSKFLNEMKKQGFVNLKQQKDVESITEFDKTHPDMRDIDASGLDLAPKAGGTETEATAAASSIQSPTITEVYVVTTNTLPVFKPLGLQRGVVLTAVEVRNLLKQYSQQNELEGPQSRGFVTLDPFLADVLLSKGEYLECLRLDQLTSRCLSKMTLAHRMELNGQPPVIKKGKLEPVSLKVVQRAGNKKATMIDNLEVYGIDPQEFAHTVQKGVACSTSVQPLPGKSQGLQVLVQGNQTVYIANLLTDKYMLQRKWIVGAEKAGKGKKR